MNVVCGQHLRWPDKSVQDGLVHRRHLQPDLHGENDAICSGLREKTADMDEDTANYLFCTANWNETKEIFQNERWWIYTDWNVPSHRGSGLKFMYSHKIRCRQFLRKLPKGFKLDQKIVDMWVGGDDQEQSNGNFLNATMSADQDFKDTILELEDDEDTSEKEPEDATLVGEGGEKDPVGEE